MFSKINISFFNLGRPKTSSHNADDVNCDVFYIRVAGQEIPPIKPVRQSKKKSTQVDETPYVVVKEYQTTTSF